MATTADQIFNKLRFNTNGIFDVQFRRRTRRPDGTAQPGELRHMICYGMGQEAGPAQQFRGNVIPTAIRDAEDFRCAVLTVWSIDVCNALLAQGVPPLQAGARAWRRIDLVTVESLPNIVPADQLPPDVRANIHGITNAYRLANMPRGFI